LVKGGYILLYRYDPRRVAAGKVGLQLDSKTPEFSLTPLTKGENRFSALVDIYPKQAEKKHPQLIADLKKRYNYYLNLSKGA
jgi:pyruvate-ferredoxin/flavodoxin oxidoreductase